VFRESELFSVLRSLFRKIEVGMIAVPRWERTMQHLTSLDRWLLTRVPMLRPLASYSVVSLFKPDHDPGVEITVPVTATAHSLASLQCVVR
jgi:hypothetical protein